MPMNQHPGGGPPSVITTAGYLMYAAGLVGEGQAALGSGPSAPLAASNAVWLALFGLLTTLINAVYTDRQRRREAARDLDDTRAAAEQQVQAAKIDADRKILEAKAAADQRIATLEARLAEADRAYQAAARARHHRMDAMGATSNELVYHATQNAQRINEMLPVLAELAKRIGVESPEVEPAPTPIPHVPPSGEFPAVAAAALRFPPPAAVPAIPPAGPGPSRP